MTTIATPFQTGILGGFKRPTWRHGVAVLLGALVLVAGCGGNGASATPVGSTQPTATAAGSAFLFSTVVPSPTTVAPSTATALPPTSTEAPTIATVLSPTVTDVPPTSTDLPVEIIATPPEQLTPSPTLAPPKATPAPAATRPRPTATRVPVVPTATPAGVTFLAVKGAKPGQAASVSVQTAPGATCSIAFSAAHGTDTVPTDLVPKKADSQGHISWSWPIGAGTTPGTGAVIVTCGKASAFSNIVIG